jgi:hypothetical protein
MDQSPISEGSPQAAKRSRLEEPDDTYGLAASTSAAAGDGGWEAVESAPLPVPQGMHHAPQLLGLGESFTGRAPLNARLQQLQVAASSGAGQLAGGDLALAHALLARHPLFKNRA